MTLTDSTKLQCWIWRPLGYLAIPPSQNIGCLNILITHALPLSHHSQFFNSSISCVLWGHYLSICAVWTLNSIHPFLVVFKETFQPCRHLSIMLPSHPSSPPLTMILRNARAMWYSYQKVISTLNIHIQNNMDKILF